MKTANKQKAEVTSNLDQMECYGDIDRIRDLIFQQYKHILINEAGGGKEILFDLKMDADGSHIPIILSFRRSSQENPINGERSLAIQVRDEKGYRPFLQMLNQGEVEELAGNIANNWVKNIFPLIIGS